MTDHPTSLEPFDIVETGYVLEVRLTGDWSSAGKTAGTEHDPVRQLLDVLQPRLSQQMQVVVFDGSQLTSWDTRLLVAIKKLEQTAGKTDTTVDLKGMPEGVRTLLNLSQAVPLSL